jgi:hypothetical protein
MSETTTARSNDRPSPEWVHETTVGGGLSPCPFCGVPRCQRSDYVRCSKCGVNWLDGENLTKDPRNARYLASKPAGKVSEPQV